jgi:hypothetical protein
LFPTVAQAWAERVRLGKELAVMAGSLAELDGVDPFKIPNPDVLGDRAATLAGDLVEPARSEALEKLGEGPPALVIARDWVRAMLEPVGSLADEVRSLPAPTP